MNYSRTAWVTFSMATLLGCCPLILAGDLSPAIVYVRQSVIRDGGWQYDFVLFNGSQTPSIGNVYKVTFDFPSTAFPLVLPLGWTTSINRKTVETFSTNPGTPPAGTDGPPGALLEHFIFAVQQQFTN